MTSLELLAQAAFSGKALYVAAAALGGGIGIGLIGAKAAEATSSFLQLFLQLLLRVSSSFQASQ